MRGKILLVLSGLVLGAFGMFLVMSGPLTVVKAQCEQGPCPETDPECYPCGNGDVNGSGGLDIADAIYLLTHLFAEGPPPVRLRCNDCCPPIETRMSLLPATGQIDCYDDGQPDAHIISCAEPAYPGQDGLYQAGCPMEGRFVDNADGTVTDNCTGLTWQQATADTNDNGVVDGNDDIVWAEALRYCDALILCEDGTWTTEPAEAATHGGIKYDDWRLPNVRELQSIVDYGRYGPAIDPVFSAESSWYWSSSSYVNVPSYACHVDFYLGFVLRDGKSDLHCVRAVRG